MIAAREHQEHKGRSVFAHLRVRSRPFPRFGILSALLLVLSVVGCAHRPPTEKAAKSFTYGTDTFAFANETVWKYEDGRHVPHGRDAAKEDRYTHHCFVMTRAATEFWKFARFDASQPVPDDATLVELVKQVRRHRTAGKPLPEAQRVVIPGFASLHDLSAKKPRLVQAEIGTCWQTYLRPANFFIVMPPAHWHQARTFNYMTRSLEQDTPVGLWMYNFPNVNMNHSVIAYAQRFEAGRTLFTIYDPNSTDGPRTLTYDEATREFSLEKTFYFSGGRVHVRLAYVSLLQ